MRGAVRGPRWAKILTTLFGGHWLGCYGDRSVGSTGCHWDDGRSPLCWTLGWVYAVRCTGGAAEFSAIGNAISIAGRWQSVGALDAGPDKPNFGRSPTFHEDCRTGMETSIAVQLVTLVYPGNHLTVTAVTGILLLVAGLIQLPEAAGLLAFATWWISYDGSNDPSSLISPTVLTAPHALVAFGWVIVGLMLRSRGNKRLEEPARVQ